MIVKLKILLASVMCVAIHSEIHSTEKLQTHEVMLTVLTQHSADIVQLKEDLKVTIDNLQMMTNLIGNIVPIGAIIEYSGKTNVPCNWLECNGDYIRQDQYSELFQVIQDTYGPPSIITINNKTLNTFKLPDRRGYVAVGIGSDNSTGGRVTNNTANNLALGKTFGEEAHTLTIAEMPTHSHETVLTEEGDYAAGSNRSATRVSSRYTIHTNDRGNDQPHNNMQPSIFMKFYIRAK